jgi:hypothetical protein
MAIAGEAFELLGDRDEVALLEVVRAGGARKRQNCLAARQELFAQPQQGEASDTDAHDDWMRLVCIGDAVRHYKLLERFDDFL